MKAKIHQITFLFCIFLLTVSCEEDSSTQPLPEDRYPLEIAAVTLGVEGGEAQPWTRVAETADGMGSEFRPGDAIAVSMNGEVATYTYDGSKWTSEQPLYWQSAGQTAEIAAWHPATDAPIDFTHQGLAYLLKADAATATAGQPVSLNFTHQLAKVRVQLAGSKAKDVTAVTVRSYPSSTHTQGALDAQDRTLTPQYVPMLQAEYNGQKCWEANLRPGTLQAGATFRVSSEGGTPVQATLAADVPIRAGQLYTITISVNAALPEGTQEITDATGNISGEGTYVVRGNDRTTPINITGGKPTIYLDEANISVGSGNAINITNNATPTIYVVGENNNISTSKGAGIYVAEGSTVTITGSSWDDELTVRGGDGRPGIGGCIADDDYHGVSCGNIYISNITVSAYGSQNITGGNLAPGIGFVGDVTCGTITISSAMVHAFGIENYPYSIPGIGCGGTSTEEPESIPDVIASNSEIHAHRGDPGYTCDYIGWQESEMYPSYNAASTINPGAGGSITSSTVYCYTGDTLDKTVEYDDQGTGTEITQ